MPSVSIRYIVDDVDAAIDFYCRELGFQEVMHPAPTFAMLSRGDLRLVVTSPGGGPGGGGPGGGGPGGGGPGGPGGGGGRGGPAMFGHDEYYISFLGQPSATEPWMMQFGGHHLAQVGGGGGMRQTIRGREQVSFQTLRRRSEIEDTRWVSRGVKKIGGRDDMLVLQ